MNIRQLLDALGYKSGNHDTDVRDALKELHTLRKARSPEDVYLPEIAAIIDRTPNYLREVL